MQGSRVRYRDLLHAKTKNGRCSIGRCKRVKRERTDFPSQAPSNGTSTASPGISPKCSLVPNSSCHAKRVARVRNMPLDDRFEDAFAQMYGDVVSGMGCLWRIITVTVTVTRPLSH